jgi:hypothetical protein
MKVFSFIPADGSWKFTFNADLKVFFNYLAQNQGYPINNQNLIGMFLQVAAFKRMLTTKCSLPAGNRALHWRPNQVHCLKLQRQRQRLSRRLYWLSR